MHNWLEHVEIENFVDLFGESRFAKYALSVEDKLVPRTPDLIFNSIIKLI
jgi:hypothetical protein